MKILNKICTQCNIEFKPKPGSSGKFCGRVCFDASDVRLNVGKNAKQLRIDDYNKNPKQCQHCSGVIAYKQRVNRFCSSTCSAIYNNTGRLYNKQYNKPVKSPKKINKYYTYRSKPKIIKPVIYVGEHTRVYCNTCKKTGRVFFSKTFRKYHPSVYTDKQLYYYQAQFRFALTDYPEYFDLNLIKQYGMYSTPGSRNGKKNLGGVSRDHLISVSYGYENNIDPSIIAHPANCRLMLHSENNSKNSNCTITLTELMEHIGKFGTDPR